MWWVLTSLFQYLLLRVPAPSNSLSGTRLPALFHCKILRNIGDFPHYLPVPITSGITSPVTLSPPILRGLAPCTLHLPARSSVAAYPLTQTPKQGSLLDGMLFMPTVENSSKFVITKLSWTYLGLNPVYGQLWMDQVFHSLFHSAVVLMVH